MDSQLNNNFNNNFNNNNSNRENYDETNMYQQAADAETVLILLAKEQAILPVSSDAFAVAQSSLSQLKKLYLGARVIWQDGTESSIEQIAVKGWCGQSMPSKLLSALVGERDIDVQFSERTDVELEAFKQAVIDFIKQDQLRDDPYFYFDTSVKEVCQLIHHAPDVMAIFQAMNTPEPEYCLDLL